MESPDHSYVLAPLIRTIASTVLVCTSHKLSYQTSPGTRDPLIGLMGYLYGTTCGPFSSVWQKNNVSYFVSSPCPSCTIYWKNKRLVTTYQQHNHALLVHYSHYGWRHVNVVLHKLFWQWRYISLLNGNYQRSPYTLQTPLIFLNRYEYRHNAYQIEIFQHEMFNQCNETNVHQNIRYIDQGRWWVDLSKWWSTKIHMCDIQFYMLSWCTHC